MPDRSGRGEAALGALAGASTGAIAANSDPIRNLLVYLKTRPGSPYRIYGSSAMSPDLFNGSGEGMMTQRLARLFADHGIGMTYSPSNLNPYSYREYVGGLQEYGEPLHGTGQQQLDQIMSSPAWRGREVPFNREGQLIQRKVRGISEILDKDPKLKKKFLSDVLAGKYTGTQVGRIRDLGVLDPSLLTKPELISSSALASAPKIEFNAFRGFDPIQNRGWDPRGGLTHAQNLLDSVTPEGRYNLGSLMGFEANLSGKSDRMIPAVNVPSIAQNKYPFLARRIHDADRKSLIDFISGVRGDDFASKIGNKKIVFVTGGSVGPNGIQRLRDTVGAASRRNDVHVLFQTGSSQYSPNLERVISELQAEHPGVFTTVGRVEASKMNKFINGADAYIPYGGSSSAIEAGGHYTPMAFSTDDLLNRGNIDFVRKVRNSGGYDGVGLFDNVTTGYASALDDFKRRTGRLPLDSELDDIVSELARTRRLAGANGRGILKSLMSDPTTLSKAVDNNNRVFDRLMSDADRGARYSRETRNSVKGFLGNLEASNKNAVRTARDAILSLVERDDQAAMKASRDAFKKLFSRGGGKADALKRLLSRNGMKGSLLRMGNTFFKTPQGRRFGLPLMALGALGAGGAAYGTSRYASNRNKGFLDKVTEMFGKKASFEEPYGNSGQTALLASRITKMTRYEQGFLTKCAQYGVDGRRLLGMQKRAGVASKGISNILSGLWRIGKGSAQTAAGVAKGISGTGKVAVGSDIYRVASSGDMNALRKYILKMRVAQTLAAGGIVGTGAAMYASDGFDFD